MPVTGLTIDPVTGFAIDDSISGVENPRPPMPPLFPVATHKFIALSLCTFGVYEWYWCYQNWKRLKPRSEQNVWPFWRAVFSPLWNFSLFQKIEADATSEGVPSPWSPSALAGAYLLLCGCGRLGDPWWLVSLLSVLPLIPVQITAQQINERYIARRPESRNGRYSADNVAAIAVGGFLVISAVLGTLMSW